MTFEKKKDVNLEGIILKLRGENVILAPDLARLFGVETKVLNQAVKRNLKKFPQTFMFQLTNQEVRKIAVTNCDHNFNMMRSLPYAFTEHGSLMAATVLNSDKAIEMSIYIIEAFVAMRRMTVNLKELADKVAELDRKYGKHDEMLHLLSQILFAEKSLSPAHEIPVPPKKRKIGFGNRKTSEIVS